MISILEIHLKLEVLTHCAYRFRFYIYMMCEAV